MSTFDNKNGSCVVQNLIDIIHENVQYLSEVDGAIGDGDHGINMDKGFQLTRERLKGKEVSFSEAMKVLGQTLLMDSGGSMGPLYGTFFTEIAKGCKNVESIDANTFRKALNTACDKIFEIGSAKVGDKTMLDCLYPAVQALNRSIDTGKSFEEALSAMQEAAVIGKDATKEMIAKVGRASRLGERSRGVLDVGAASCNIILQSMANTIKELL